MRSYVWTGTTLAAICVSLACNLLLAVDRAHTLAERASSAETHTCKDVNDFETCHASHAEGCTDSSRLNTYDAYLNLLKNGTPEPASAQPVQVFTTLKEFQDLDAKAAELGLERNDKFNLPRNWQISGKATAMV